MAKKYRVSAGTILAIARGTGGRRHMGAAVTPLTAGLRTFNPENRAAGRQRRGVVSQVVHYSWLGPAKKVG